MDARMATIATVIISSISVKPRAAWRRERVEWCMLAALGGDRRRKSWRTWCLMPVDVVAHVPVRRQLIWISVAPDCALTFAYLVVSALEEMTMDTLRPSADPATPLTIRSADVMFPSPLVSRIASVGPAPVSASKMYW